MLNLSKVSEAGNRLLSRPSRAPVLIKLGKRAYSCPREQIGAENTLSTPAPHGDAS